MARREEFVRRRAALGFTQESLAEHLSVDRTTIGRWERGTLTPTPLYQPRLARALRVSPQELGVLLSTESMPEVFPQTTWHEQSTLDRELLGHMQEQVAVINGQVGSAPFVRLQLQLAPIVELCQRFLLSDHSGLRAELMALATKTYALAARLAFETRDDENAMTLYVAATQAAGGLNDRSERAAVRTSHAMVTLHASKDLAAARTIAHAATVDAQRDASYAVRARAHAVHAEICARAGQATESAVSLDRAWTSVDRLTADDPHGGFNAERLDGFDGLCALHAGNASHAHDRLDRSLTTLTTSRDAVQRGVVGADLALARLRLGDPIACVRVLHETVDIAAVTGGRVPAQRIRLVRQALRPWQGEHFLAELDDHIHDTLIGR